MRPKNGQSHSAPYHLARLAAFATCPFLTMAVDGDGGVVMHHHIEDDETRCV